MTELLILIGLPASGKSTFAKYDPYTAGWVIVSKDNLGTKAGKQDRQMRAITSALTVGSNVVVDNCNLTAAERAPLVALAKSFEARVAAMCFPPDLKLSIERNSLRTGKALVPEFVVRKMFREIERPTLGEGFDEILGRWS